MELIVTLKQVSFSLEICQKGKAIDVETAKYYHNLSEMLINHLDNLLKRNKLDLNSIKSYKLLGNLGQDSTSYKIASALIEALKISA